MSKKPLGYLGGDIMTRGSLAKYTVLFRTSQLMTSLV